MSLDFPRFALLVGLSTMSLACASSIGPAGSYITHSGGVPSLGVEGSSLVELPLLDGDEQVAVGVQGRILQRATDGGDQWGQWRVQSLVGLSDMPRKHESRVGYELFLTPGFGRFQSKEGTRVSFAGGAQLGLPLRLAPPSAPRWRADDLVGLNGYLVPSIGANLLGGHTFEMTAGLSGRFLFWSSITP